MSTKITASALSEFKGILHSGIDLIVLKEVDKLKQAVEDTQGYIPTSKESVELLEATGLLKLTQENPWPHYRPTKKGKDKYKLLFLN